MRRWMAPAPHWSVAVLFVGVGCSSGGARRRRHRSPTASRCTSRRRRPARRRCCATPRVSRRPAAPRPAPSTAPPPTGPRPCTRAQFGADVATVARREDAAGCGRRTTTATNAPPDTWATTGDGPATARGRRTGRGAVDRRRPLVPLRPGRDLADRAGRRAASSAAATWPARSERPARRCSAALPPDGDRPVRKVIERAGGACETAHNAEFVGVWQAPDKPVPEADRTTVVAVLRRLPAVIGRVRRRAAGRRGWSCRTGVVPCSPRCRLEGRRPGRALLPVPRRPRADRFAQGQGRRRPPGPRPCRSALGHLLRRRAVRQTAQG